METIEVDGKRIRVYRQGTGRPIVYLHSGAGEVGRIPFFLELEQAGFAVTVPELSGFGRSDPAPEWRHIEDAIFHLRRVLEILDIDRCALVGSSLGGWLAAELAVWFPERIEALVLIGALGLRIEGAPVYDMLGGPESSPEELMRRSNPHGLDMLEVLKSVVGGDDDPQTMTLHFIRGSVVMAQLGWDPHMHDPKLLDRLRSVIAPTLVLWGADDGVAPLAHGEAYAASIPNARLEIIPDCGHMPVFEHPDKVSEMIADFVGANLQRRC